MSTTVLIIDDDPVQRRLAEAMVRRLGFEARVAENGLDGLNLLRAGEGIDVVLLDLVMPGGMDGLGVLAEMRKSGIDTPVIVQTSNGSIDAVVNAMRAGAVDFVVKPAGAERLQVSIKNALRVDQLEEEVRRMRRRASGSLGFKDLASKSPDMDRVIRLAERAAKSNIPVLIEGESGVGKEVLARAIQGSGERRGKPFVTVNCGAIPDNLVESTLFGHEKGAFTGATERHVGKFVEASGGTLFLDEIGELPVDVQPKLLRALQERKVRPVGANQEIPFDARIVAATNRNLEDEVYEKRFREDLYYRINVVKIDVPPLRERGGDVLHLAQHFLKQFAARNEKSTLELSTTGAEKLMAYNWPGNVRELENCMEHAVALARFDQITVEDLPEKIRAYRAERFVVAANDPTEIVTMDELERRYILRVLALVGGNKSRAAQVLGFDRRTLYRKLERYGDTAAVTDAAEA